MVFIWKYILGECLSELGFVRLTDFGISEVKILLIPKSYESQFRQISGKKKSKTFWILDAVF